jgi:hypothetical protein
MIGVIFSVGSVGGILGSMLAPRIQKRYRFGQVIISVVWIMVGLTRKEWTGDWTLARNPAVGPLPLLPPIERYGLKIMSAGFILAEDQPMLLSARTVRLLMRQLVQQVDWGHLIFSRVPDSRAIWTLGVEKLGTVPLDPTVSQAGDRGCRVLVAHTDSPQATAFRQVAQRVVEKRHAPS